MKIAKMITQEYGKMSFAPSELQAAYQTISQDYKSSLSPAQYKKIKDIVKLFVDKGGKIEFIYE